MSYLNGKDVFPPALLMEIQRYVQGACVYIPKVGERAKKTSDLRERNAEIRSQYAEGKSVKVLAGEYYLSPQAIYKILAAGRKQEVDS